MSQFGQGWKNEKKPKRKKAIAWHVRRIPSGSSIEDSLDRELKTVTPRVPFKRKESL